MRHIEVVAGSFALVDDNKVLGVVTKTSETQWGFFPLVRGDSGLNYVPLQHALEAALEFNGES